MKRMTQHSVENAIQLLVSVDGMTAMTMMNVLVVAVGGRVCVCDAMMSLAVPAAIKDAMALVVH